MLRSGPCVASFHTLRVLSRSQTACSMIPTVLTKSGSLPSIPTNIHKLMGSNAACLAFEHKHHCFTRAFSSAASGNQEINSTKVLYDGECKLCALEISGLKRIARNKREVEFVDITSPGFDDPSKFGGVTYEDAMKEMHVIDSSGQVRVQGDAIRHMYRACGLGWLASATELPGVKPFCDRLYVKFAEYRLRKALNRCDSESDRCSIKLRHLKEKLKKV